MNETVQQVKRFVFSTKLRKHDKEVEKLEILIPEIIQAAYSFYTWPCASVLAWYIWENRRQFKNKSILEIGAGTSLPGILAAKIGAKVTLSDSKTLPKSLEHIRRCVQINNLVVDADIKVIGITWGLFLNDLIQFSSVPLDYILASDCFYEPSIFEDIFALIEYLFESNPNCKFLFTYQERSSDWCIENLLKKWQMTCKIINIEDLGAQADLALADITGDHTICLYEMTKKV